MYKNPVQQSVRDIINKVRCSSEILQREEGKDSVKERWEGAREKFNWFYNFPVVNPVFKEENSMKNMGKYVLMRKMCLIRNVCYSKSVNVFNIYM